MPNLYNTYSKGAALGSVAVVICDDEKTARILHCNATGYPEARVELKQKGVDYRVNGKKQNNVILYSWNGDY